MALAGNTATIAFGTSSFTGSITKIGGFEQSREVLDSSVLSLAVGAEMLKVAGDLIEPGEFEVELFYDVDLQPPIIAAAETITVTMKNSGPTNPANIAGTGFVSKWSSPDIEINSLMVATLTVQWDGATGPTFTDAAA